MDLLSEQQIDFILQDLLRSGISNPDLRAELLDHFCVLIEESLEEAGDFESLYRTVIKSFYRHRLSEIEEATELAVHHRLRLVEFRRGTFFAAVLVLIMTPVVASVARWLITSGASAGYRIPLEVWGGTLVYAMFPLLIWLVLLLTPERLDPLIPRGARIAIGWRPFFCVLRPGQ